MDAIQLGLSRGPRAAVLGSPIAHSLSPALHRAAYRSLGLPWTYDPYEAQAADLPRWVAALRDPREGWRGLSLTMPLKQAVMPLLDEVSAIALATGAVNTVWSVPSYGAARLHGDNTDVQGIIAALGTAGIGPSRSAGIGLPPTVGIGPSRTAGGSDTVAPAAILGAGATAASALAALCRLGLRQPDVHLRSPGRAGDLLGAAHRLDADPRLVTIDPDRLDLTVQALARAEVVVATMPSGAADGLASALEAASLTGGLQVAGVLLDVVYDPWPTALATAWRRAGGVAVSGLEMLLAQAAVQVRLMTGLTPAEGPMRAAADDALKVRVP